MTDSYQEIGNGVPISLVVTTLEISRIQKYTYYFSTFGENHVCTVAACSKCIEKNKLQNAYVVACWIIHLESTKVKLLNKHNAIHQQTYGSVIVPKLNKKICDT
jgi:acetylornithine/succinyldiaminopimelate/putrescine aminotransferase